MLKNCTSCGMQTKNYSSIPDAESDGSVIRCKHCRQLSVPYNAPSKTQGP
ncbi:MAG: hypothetical protein WC492_04275 [Candidatus Micrarchaeia archaeon]